MAARVVGLLAGLGVAAWLAFISLAYALGGADSGYTPVDPVGPLVAAGAAAICAVAIGFGAFWGAAIIAVGSVVVSLVFAWVSAADLGLTVGPLLVIAAIEALVAWDLYRRRGQPAEPGSPPAG